MKDVEQGKVFLMHLHLEINKLCMVRSYYMSIECFCYYKGSQKGIYWVN
jgi:hypothetical protein